MISANDIQFTTNIDPLDVAGFFVQADQLRDEPDVTPMKLQKLLYLAQANYLASTNERLFNANIEAFEHGPVVYVVSKEFSGSQIISPEAHPRKSSLLPDDVEAFLEQIWVRYQDSSASALRRLTHEQTPWRDHYIPDQYRTVIPDSAMRSYFRETVPAAERVFHPNVVPVISDIFEDDPVADLKLQAFLAG